MTRSLAHRGPDGEGVRAFASRDGGLPATLGHRRLAIIDPTPRGAQPMASADQRYWITYNGELYNFRELRAELERDGERFRSDCDTEVLLAMWARHGPAALDRLNGIFAFAIWDAERRRALPRPRQARRQAARTTRSHDGLFAFASEIKALLHALPRPGMNRRALADYLTFLWVPDPETMFEGVLDAPRGPLGALRGRRLRDPRVLGHELRRPATAPSSPGSTRSRGPSRTRSGARWSPTCRSERS